MGPEGVTQRQAWPMKVLIWGCFPSAGPGSLHVAVGTLKTAQYIEVLEKNEFLKLSNGLVKMNGFPFKPMPLAIPQRLLNGLLRNKGLMCVPWPTHSPDVNPILKEKFRKKKI